MSVREPSPLARAAGAARPVPWWNAHAFGIVAFVAGVVGFAVIALTQEPLWSTPDAAHSAPVLAVTALAAGASFLRRERAIALPLVGLGLAAAAAVLGWFLLTLVVVAATAAVILLLSQVM